MAGIGSGFRGPPGPKQATSVAVAEAVKCRSGLGRDPQANMLRLNTTQGQETSSFEAEAQSEGSRVTAELKRPPEPHHKPIMPQLPEKW